MSDELRLVCAVEGDPALHVATDDQWPDAPLVYVEALRGDSWLDLDDARQLRDLLDRHIRKHAPRHCSEDAGDQLTDRDGAESIAAAVAKHVVAEGE